MIGPGVCIIHLFRFMGGAGSWVWRWGRNKRVPRGCTKD